MHKVLDPNKISNEAFFAGEYDFSEMCPHCNEEIPIVIDQSEFIRYRITCPTCGKKMMLCNLCYDHDICDWCKEEPCFRERFEDLMTSLEKYR